ncbi:Ppx/GppA phosphatase family protein [Acutalibacter caecimuris]|uniref:Ppx/GppA phosphatase family protein n=1 Tax=Acutalibacter caecimuris TaxID=3093657 RepID=UPI002AC972AA|nr:hypothetical protein [Acutalibacter sp. M00118]
MNKKSAVNSAAVIEIGTKNVKMRVSQLVKGKIRPLDYLEYPVSLDHDVFEAGAVRFDSLRELSAALTKFSAALRAYNIERPMVISTTALREASNRALVIDQLRVRNGVDITVLDGSQEKAYIFSELEQLLSQESAVKNGNTLMAYIGSGSIGLMVHDGEKAVYFQNIPIGALKLHDVLGELRRKAEGFHCILEEYMDTVLNRMHISGYPIQNLVLTGSKIELIARLCGAKKVGPVYHIETEKLQALYDAVRAQTAESIALRYGITENQAALLYTALFIYRGMMRFCPGAAEVLSPPTDISQGVTRYLLAPKAGAGWPAYLRGNSLSCAWAMARAFHCDEKHSRLVGDYAVKLFDRLKKVHGLDPSKRLILELAAALHSCGSYVSVRQHNHCTFDIIRGMDIFGLSSGEVLEVAMVAGSITGGLLQEEAPEMALLPQQEQIVVSKLSAVFRLANAMDKSHLEKLKNIKMTLEEDRVLIRAEASTNTLLERWAFEESAGFFQKVFGLSPELSIKFDMM